MSLNELAYLLEKECDDRSDLFGTGRGKKTRKISKQRRKEPSGILLIPNRKGESKWKNCLGQ
jgi:hypothetical protein